MRSEGAWHSGRSLRSAPKLLRHKGLRTDPPFPIRRRTQHRSAAYPHVPGYSFGYLRAVAEDRHGAVGMHYIGGGSYLRRPVRRSLAKLHLGSLSLSGLARLIGLPTYTRCISGGGDRDPFVRVAESLPTADNGFGPPNAGGPS